MSRAIEELIMTVTPATQGSGAEFSSYAFARNTTVWIKFYQESLKQPSPVQFQWSPNNDLKLHIIWHNRNEYQTVDLGNLRKSIKLAVDGLRDAL